MVSGVCVIYDWGKGLVILHVNIYIYVKFIMLVYIEYVICKNALYILCIYKYIYCVYMYIYIYNSMYVCIVM